MPWIDQHLHTHHSVDSQADPAGYLAGALELGLGGFTLTEHYDPHPTEWAVCIYDAERIAATVSELRAAAAGRMFIGEGIEVCYQPTVANSLLDHLASRRFDLVLLSVHWFNGRALHVPEHWGGLDVATATQLYLQEVLKAVRWVRELKRQGRQPFHVLGHLDLVKRYTQRYLGGFIARPDGDLIEAILVGCLEADLVPELNLSTLRNSVGEPMPAFWAIKRYAELGGTAVSLGSDAHCVEHLAAGFPEAAQGLKEAGIHYEATFQGGQRIDIPL